MANCEDFDQTAHQTASLGVVRPWSALFVKACLSKDCYGTHFLYYDN